MRTWQAMGELETAAVLGECQTISPLLAAGLGLELISRIQLARHIETADLVIPC